MGRLIRLPVRPALRVVEALPPSTSAHLQREVQEVQISLRRALRHFGADDAASISELSAERGTEELETALFYALNLRGCLNADMELRRALLARIEKREAARG
ncbi:hypothetical protein EDE05_12843 [Neorhizobium sp. R1-B]|uniref:hypothetical protein n=1 Tax=Neorhizobium sp. R1-B TaxID=2485162 RepID=UPI001066E88B|nr:hypothetical protein [Neorhizobium sp. R1-B]TDX72622.1 hypothetical protein EDE05_12843 [Neorhizobium sp. R1-B]